MARAAAKSTTKASPLDPAVDLIAGFCLSINKGDLLVLDGNYYVTHAGLLRLARHHRCRGIEVQPVPEYSDPKQRRWAFRATVFKSATCKGFVGYGDADPSNVSPLVRGAEMRVAETRAVNRALRKAYGIGLCSAEEIGSRSNGNHSGAGHSEPPTLRDRLNELIRQHGLDATLVKAYAADFCGTEKLRDASRELVEDFIEHLSARVRNDREALVTDLSRYHVSAGAKVDATSSEKQAKAAEASS